MEKMDKEYQEIGKKPDPIKMKIYQSI